MKYVDRVYSSKINDKMIASIIFNAFYDIKNMNSFLKNLFLFMF